MICAYAAQPCTLYIAAVAVSGRYFPESNALGVSRPVWVDQAEGLIGREVRSFRKSRNSRRSSRNQLNTPSLVRWSCPGNAIYATPWDLVVHCLQTSHRSQPLGRAPASRPSPPASTDVLPPFDRITYLPFPPSRFAHFILWISPAAAARNLEPVGCIIIHISTTTDV